MNLTKKILETVFEELYKFENEGLISKVEYYGSVENMIEQMALSIEKLLSGNNDQKLLR